MNILRALLPIVWLCLTTISANAEVKLAAPVLVTRQLDNGFIYSLYPSDDSQTAEHGEDVSLTMIVGIGSNQETDEQLGVAEIVGNAAGEYFRFSRDTLTEFGFGIDDINASNLIDEIRVFKNIASGEFYNPPEPHPQDKAYIAKWYQPQFMHLSVAGQIDVKQAEQQIKRLFGELKSANILRTPRAFYAPTEGLSQVVRVQNKTNLLRILLEFDWHKANLNSFDPAVIGITIRSHMRIQANQQAGIISAYSYFNSYDGKDYIQIDLEHKGIPLQAVKWALGEVVKIRKMGIAKSDLSGFRMWLKAEAIDHFSPFKPDGNPYNISSRLAYRQSASPLVLTTSEEESLQADEFLENMDYQALDKSLKQVLSGKMRIVAVQNTRLSDKQKQQLEKILAEYNYRK